MHPRGALIGAVLLIAISGCGAAVTPEAMDSSTSTFNITAEARASTASGSATTASAEPSVAEPTTQEPTAPPAPPPAPELTAGQANALRAAENYLSLMPFSHAGLVNQLSSEYGDQYSVEDATFAADNVGADWNEQAARKQLLQLFEAWGPKDPATLDGRRRLSSMLFS